MKVFYDERYVGAKYAFDTTRKSAAVARILDGIRDVDVVSPNTCDLGDIQYWMEQVHDPAYIDALRTGTPKNLATSQGFDWDPGLWQAIYASTHGVLAATVEALTVGASGSLSSGLHHAKYDHGSGFCSVNGLVVAAEFVKQVFDRDTVIVDFDAHCGGGTESLLVRHGLYDVQHLDLSVVPFDNYVAGRAQTDSVMLNRVTDERYLNVAEWMLDSIDPTGEPLVIYNAGMDPHPYVTEATLRRRESMVVDTLKALGLPAMFVLAGGYTSSWDPKALAEAHAWTALRWADLEDLPNESTEAA
jgi:acetoin utilization deacetylase AcuC-like enzyme